MSKKNQSIIVQYLTHFNFSTIFFCFSVIGFLSTAGPESAAPEGGGGGGGGPGIALGGGGGGGGAGPAE